MGIPMSATTVSVSEETRDKLMKMKIDEGASSVDELLGQLIVEHRKLRFLEASDRFRARLDEVGLTVEQLLGGAGGAGGPEGSP